MLEIKITHWGEDYATLEIGGQEYETSLGIAHAIEAEQKATVKSARKNVALAIDAVIASIDKNYLASDGNANGSPAFQYDFQTADATHRVYISSEEKKV